MLLHLLNALYTTMLKDSVTNRKRLVNDQDLRLGGDRCSKGKPHIHPTRICLDRLMNKVAYLGESLNLGQQGFGLFAAEAHQRGVHKNILDAGKFGIKARA